MPGALTFGGPADARAVQWVLEEAVRGHRERIAVAVPSDVTWPLPAYELAIMARTEPDMQGGRHVALTVVTAEPEPLAIFGDEAGAALRELLAQRRIRLRTGALPEHITGDVLWLESGEAVLADTVLSLPRFEGPRLPGLPCDDHGFIPTDPDGSVSDRVLAAGDATSFPVKQGGLAAQQADAAAATIAQRLGARVASRPFITPVLRGVLLTGGAPLYLRAELDASGKPVRTRQRRLRSSVSTRALWWPPGRCPPLPRPVHGHRAARYPPTSRWWIASAGPASRLAIRSRSETMPHDGPLTTTQWMRLSAIVRASVATSASGGQWMTPTCIALRTVWVVSVFVIMARP